VTDTAATTTSVDGDAPLLVVDNLVTHFIAGRRRIRAVDGVSFRLARGATLGVVGESGSGKTIMARSLMGLLPEEGLFQAGSVRFEGEELIGLSKRQHRAIWGPGMAMVFQDPLTSLNPVMKIGPQITEAIKAHRKMGRADALDLAVDLLRSVHIPEPARRLGQYPNELSGGMRQRVAIAIALSCGPRLLIADEPTTALDVTIQAEILDLLQELQEQRGMSLILVSHDLAVVAGRTDEVAVMYGGKIVEHGRTVAVFEQTRMPYTEALLGAIPRLELPSHTKLKAIGGRPPDPSASPMGCSFSPRCPYAQAKCEGEVPPLERTDSSDHLYACWYPLEPRTTPPTAVEAEHGAAEPGGSNGAARSVTRAAGA
jgi:peptide/nickel transport system ATP-binding protein